MSTEKLKEGRSVVTHKRGVIGYPDVVTEKDFTGGQEMIDALKASPKNPFEDGKVVTASTPTVAKDADLPKEEKPKEENKHSDFGAKRK